MEKNFSFVSKINKRVINSDVTIKLITNKDNKPVFTVVGHINGHYGQCLNDIAKVNDDIIFLIIYRLWKKYHLNDLHYDKNGNTYYKTICKDDLKLIYTLFK